MHTYFIYTSLNQIHILCVCLIHCSNVEFKYGEFQSGISNVWKSNLTCDFHHALVPNLLVI